MAETPNNPDEEPRERIPAMQALIDNPFLLLFIGVAILLLVPVTFFWIKDTPEEAGLTPDGADMSAEEVERLRAEMADHHSQWTLPKLLKNREAWLISLGFGLLFIVTVGIVTQLVPTMTVGEELPVEQLKNNCRAAMSGLGYLEVMTKNLKVMDATAIAFCRDNDIPIVVFDMSKPGSLRSIVQGGHEGTLVHDG